MRRALPSLDTTTVLANLLEEPLVVVDVGCRWGFSDIWDRLGDRCVTIGFDPDKEECERLARRYRGQRQVELVPLALAREAGLATLYLTENPAGYSLYPPAVPAVERHPGLRSGRLERTALIEVTTLDDWLATSDHDGVDVIKLDTQGSELDILVGASRTLDGVRAIEVEVQFNELYEGVPLFGDVDRFLRDKGFLLWRIRHLAHYAQHGADRRTRTPEPLYFDETVATFLAGSGQLFWANAFYVREEVAHPDGGLGWMQLVRDACATSAFGFHDLVGLALEQAGAVAPPNKAAALVEAGSDDLVAALRERELGEEALRLRDSLVVDFGDPLFAGTGWRPPERYPFAAVRWSGPAREAWIDVPCVLDPGTRVELLEVAAMTAPISENMALEVNRTPISLIASPHEHGTLHAGVVPDDYSSSRRFTRLLVRTIDTVPWNELHPESSDEREMGVAVAWVRITPP